MLIINIDCMEQYTIYCTNKQTNKALELGAPIEVDFQFNSKTAIINKKAYIVPTAEQMIGWLRMQGIHPSVLYSKRKDRYNVQCFELKDAYIRDEEGAIKNFLSYKEATLAAIDAALDYLSKNN